ncbi:hypothetical protein [Candidatus Proelusimicrobium excrementi]|uniref:hypothetical protein n=1 Tax=Candidatus Proelusimicrobium excrementi TaxID=3416222 RepID=UPI003D0F0976
MRYLFLAVLLFSAVACTTPNGNKLSFSSLNPQTDISPAKPTVSYEMYSWYNGQDWAYAIIENGVKLTTSFKQITEDDNIIVGSAYLKDKLLEMPRGTKVYWNLKRIKGFQMPDEKTIESIVSAAKKAGVSVEVIAWPN